MEISKSKVHPIPEESFDEINNQMNTNEIKSVNKTLTYFLPVMTFIILIVVSAIGIIFGLKLWQVVESPLLIKGMKMYDSNKLIRISNNYIFKTESHCALGSLTYSNPFGNFSTTAFSMPLSSDKGSAEIAMRFVLGNNVLVSKEGVSCIWVEFEEMMFNSDSKAE